MFVICENVMFNWFEKKVKEKENGDCTNLVFSGSVFIDKSCLGLTDILIIGN